MDAVAYPAQGQLRGINMKKLWEKIKEVWYGALPILLLVGGPLAIAVAAFLIGYWNDIPKILSHITDIGNGSLLYGAFLILFGLVGLVNVVIAYWMWFNALTKWLDRLQKNGKPQFLLWIIVIIIVCGWVALSELIKLL